LACLTSAESIQILLRGARVKPIDIITHAIFVGVICAIAVGIVISVRSKISVRSEAGIWSVVIVIIIVVVVIIVIILAGISRASVLTVLCHVLLVSAGIIPLQIISQASLIAVISAITIILLRKNAAGRKARKQNNK
jgi:hypothetical protein